MDSYLRGLEQLQAQLQAQHEHLSSSMASQRSGQTVVILPEEDDPCANCGRVFEPQRMAMHTRACGRLKKRTPPAQIAAQQHADDVRQEALELVHSELPALAKAPARRPLTAPAGSRDNRAAAQEDERPPRPAPKGRKPTAPPPVSVPSTRRQSDVPMAEQTWYQEEMALLQEEERERERGARSSGAQQWQEETCMPVEDEDYEDELVRRQYATAPPSRPPQQRQPQQQQQQPVQASPPQKRPSPPMKRGATPSPPVAAPSPPPPEQPPEQPTGAPHRSRRPPSPPSSPALLLPPAAAAVLGCLDARTPQD